MQIVLISRENQASYKEQSSSSKHQAASSKQKLGLVEVLSTVKRKRSEGDSPIRSFYSSHLWNFFMCLLLANSGASGQSFVFAIMFYLIFIISTIST